MIAEQLSKVLLQDKDCFTDIIGQSSVKTQLKTTILSNRNVIIIGPPGVGKTTIAKNVAKLLPSMKNGGSNLSGEERFVRVQGSPDLTVEDLLGDIDPIKALKYGPLSLEAFTKGKIFKADKGVLFFDELNRCPEKLQNALLQVLQERKATIGSYDVDFDADFLFIATMNPEDTTTEKLSDVLLDRFDVITMSHPESREEEERIITTNGASICKVPESLTQFIAYFVRLLRESNDLDKKPSVRASLGLYERSQAHAILHKRKTVSMEDIRAVLTSVLAHRISLKPSLKYIKKPEDIIKQEFEQAVQSNVGKDIASEGEVP